MIAHSYIFENVTLVQLSFRQKAQLFHELAQLDKSAVPLLKALEILAKDRRSAIGKLCRKAAKALEKGRSPREAFEKAGFSAQDGILAEAGSLAGRSADIYNDLSIHYTALADARKRIILSSLYPVFVFHLGVILLSIPAAILGNGWQTFGEQVIPLLLGLYIIVFCALAVLRVVRFLLRHSALGGWFLFNIPFLNSFLGAWTGSTFCGVFALLLRAGTGVLRGMNMAADACNNALLRHQVHRVEKSIRGGVGLSDAARRIKTLPEIALRSIDVGDHSGRLHEELFRAADILRENALAWLAGFARFLPKVLYAVIVVAMILKMISTFNLVTGAVGKALELP